MNSCPSCQSTAVKRTFRHPLLEVMDEYECCDCGLCLDLVQVFGVSMYVVAVQKNVNYEFDIKRRLQELSV